MKSCFPPPFRWSEVWFDEMGGGGGGGGFGRYFVEQTRNFRGPIQLGQEGSWTSRLMTELS